VFCSGLASSRGGNFETLMFPCVTFMRWCNRAKNLTATTNYIVRGGVENAFPVCPKAASAVIALMKARCARCLQIGLDAIPALGRVWRDPKRLPPFSHVEISVTKTRTLNPDTFKLDDVTERTKVLVQPFGYALKVAWKLFETVEIALWGTVLAIIVGLPLALLGASNLTPAPIVRIVSRGIVSFFRAMPELITALFLVLAYGFGPIAGVLALAIHSAVFFGKFYAEDIENADRRPQDALTAIGANRLKIFRYAILPQVLPQYIAYTLYILDRNVRMATVIGLVGAGGIGQELKGRYDMYNYGHVGTILVAIFLLVLALDQLSYRLRRTRL
jgi:phosphonate transport system permease protein